MRNVVPFRAHITAPIISPKRTLSSCSNIALPLCCPLPSHYIVTLLDNIPLPQDTGALQNALDALGCVDLLWLTANPLLDLWLQATRHGPDTFVPIEESLFILK